MKLVLFDIDGTLLISNKSGTQAHIKTCQELFGKTITQFAQAGLTDQLVVKEIVQKNKLGAEVDGGFLARYFGLYTKYIKEVLAVSKPFLLPGVAKLLEELSKNPDVVLGLLTGNVKDVAKLKLDKLDMWNYFNVGAFGDDNPDRNKLGPIAMKRAEEYLKQRFTPEDVVILGDTNYDVDCARAIGAKMIGVTYAGFSHSLNEQNTNYLFKDFHDTKKVVEAILK